MTLKIDKAVRVILPKPVRDRLGLHAGSDLELRETSEGIVLKPANSKPSLAKKGSFWVHSGEIPTGYDILKAIEEDREDRMRSVWGRVNWYFDTSILVSGAVTEHPHNTRALAILEDLVSRKHRDISVAHGLTEMYSVLTRTPFTLTPKEYEEVVRHCAASGWTGGRIHDAVQLRCAQKAGCDRIYTFNVKDFRVLASSELAELIAAP